MKTIRLYSKIYMRMASQYLKDRLQYRADFICEVFGMALVIALQLLAFWILFQNITEIGGWNYYEVVFLYGFSFISMSVHQLLLDNVWSLFWKITDGTFLKYCFRPVNILFYYMAEVIDFKGFVQFVLGTIFIIYSWIKLEIPCTILNFTMLLLMWAGSALVCMSLIILSSTFSFMGGGTNAAIILACDLKEYSRYPMTIFGKGLRMVFTFLIPVAFIAYYPCSYFLGGKGGSSIITYCTPVVGIVFFWLSCKVWIHFAERYVGTGT